MSRLVLRHECLILDADCTINLASSGQLVSILAAAPCSCAISRHVHDYEVLRNNLQLCIDRGLLQLVAPQGEEYETIVRINFEVNIPYKILGEGEIETGAIAMHRGWAIGIDDKTAREYFAKYYPRVQLITTPELLKHWVDRVAPPKNEVRQALERIRIIGNYSIGKKHHLYAWWQSWFR